MYHVQLKQGQFQSYLSFSSSGRDSLEFKFNRRGATREGYNRASYGISTQLVYYIKNRGGVNPSAPKGIILSNYTNNK